MGFELIEHTADLGLRVWAPTLDELFAEAALGLVAVMGSPRGVTEHTETVELDAGDLDALLVDWLSEVLFWFEARDLVAREVRVEVSGQGPFRLRAEVGGPPAAGFEETGPGVKAVTYHGLEVRETDAQWHARVYLDV